MHCILKQETEKRLPIQDSVKPVFRFTGTQLDIPAELLDLIFWDLWPLHCCGNDFTLFLIVILYMDGPGSCKYVLGFGQSI